MKMLQSQLRMHSMARLIARKIRAGLGTLFRPRREIYEDCYEGRQFDAMYFAMLVCSCLIALLGLLLNSPAVIIGAMLISPLMGPILACGLAVTMADWLLAKKSGRNLLFSVGETLAIAAIAAYLSPLKDLTPEILARTNPNLMDLLIAFFSGVAGTLALASRRQAFTILPGVAIATAVMPPLATVGYGISTGQWGVARGAFMLFFTNFTAIVFSAGLVFLLIGFRPRLQPADPNRRFLVRYRIVVAALAVVVLAVPLMRTLIQAANQARLRKEIRSELNAGLEPTGRRLVSLDFQASPKGVTVDAYVETAQFIGRAEVQNLEHALSQRLSRSVQLHLQQVQLAREEIPVKQPDKQKDFLSGGNIRSPVLAEHPLSLAATAGNLHQTVETWLEPLLEAVPIEQIEVESVSAEADGSLQVQFKGEAAKTTDFGAIRVAAQALAAQAGASVRLTGSVALEDFCEARFHPGSARLNAREAQALTACVRKLKAAPETSYALTPSLLAPEDVSAKRVALVTRRWLAQKQTSLLAGSTDAADAVVIRLIQQVDASANMPAAIADGPAGNTD
jgi:uncharacterized hydrophobic protein (TIGR00271 family)